jgi:hypothetical protein
LSPLAGFAEGLGPKSLKALLEARALFADPSDPDGGPLDVLVLGPWDASKRLRRLLEGAKASYMAIRRVRLPKAGTFETPPPGLLAEGPAGTFVWGCPGHGPLFGDLAMSQADAAELFPDLMVPKGLAAFKVDSCPVGLAAKPGLAGACLERALQAGSRFRHLALPRYPMGQAREAGKPGEASRILSAAQSLLGLLAGQCLNYARNVFATHGLPFDWQAVKRLMNTQAAPWPADAALRAADFGLPSPKVRKIQEIFDLLERPFLNPRLKYRNLEDADIARRLLREERERALA